jgi:hypothetical protein
MNTRQVRCRELHLCFEVGGLQFTPNDLFDPFAHLRVVAVARHVNQTRVEMPDRVATQEQPHAMALVQIDDAADRADQVRWSRVEQLVARIIL